MAKRRKRSDSEEEEFRQELDEETRELTTALQEQDDARREVERLERAMRILGIAVPGDENWPLTVTPRAPQPPADGNLQGSQNQTAPQQGTVEKAAAQGKAQGSADPGWHPPLELRPPQNYSWRDRLTQVGNTNPAELTSSIGKPITRPPVEPVEPPKKKAKKSKIESCLGFWLHSACKEKEGECERSHETLSHELQRHPQIREGLEKGRLPILTTFEMLRGWFPNLFYELGKAVLTPARSEAEIKKDEDSAQFKEKQARDKKSMPVHSELVIGKGKEQKAKLMPTLREQLDLFRALWEHSSNVRFTPMKGPVWEKQDRDKRIQTDGLGGFGPEGVVLADMWERMDAARPRLRQSTGETAEEERQRTGQTQQQQSQAAKKGKAKADEKPPPKPSPKDRDGDDEMGGAGAGGNAA